ncbi:HNH endonuclease signature motif containing protein [Marinospirillum sp.]|uniref:HNH endonuclease n=1 Tax=Marinospirillum sp. TaxID=2183934 RepID=UPI0028706B72|nr:HNH endonuclease signature motif containing protein [Marinospirillum sp.]MDR9468457.1 HNH endonuclease signature motif containing protein [Marinospirillum sp.]
MARRSKRKAPEQLRKELLEIIVNFEAKLLQDTLRDQVAGLIPAHTTLADLGSSLIPEDVATSAKSRILAYLQKYTHSLVRGEELMVVAGISEYGRRIRELRVQEGWSIVAGNTFRKMIEEGEASPGDVEVSDLTQLKPDTYILLSEECDREAAHRWNSANRIRKSDLSVKDKALAYFRENVGNKISGEEIQYLAPGATEWARRVRELRTEEGWPVSTRNSGFPELPVGFYILEEDRQAPRHDRIIPDLVRVEVLERDSHQCRSCGWSYASKRKGDPRTLLELHHIEHHKDGGANVAENLIALCNVCHDNVHRGRISAEELEDMLQS